MPTSDASHPTPTNATMPEADHSPSSSPSDRVLPFDVASAVNPDPTALNTPITLVISEVVDPDRVHEYEAWAKGINSAVQQFPGFLGVQVIRPRDHMHPEYVIIVKFDNYNNYRQWRSSATYHDWISCSRDLITTRSYQQLPNGIELWFSLPNRSTHSHPEPPFYKKVVLGVLSVYPLILLANALLGKILSGLPDLLSLLISVTFVSALLTYPVMPWLTKLLQFWLYPSSRSSSKSKQGTVSFNDSVKFR
jgi:antibiotic biosynthesis monooxygenase (ABM) superfamily enzyme